MFKGAPTWFESQRIHHQGALYSVLLKLQIWFYRVHVNGHDRIIFVILANHCTRLTDDGSSVIRNMLEHFKTFCNFNCIYELYINASVG